MTSPIAMERRLSHREMIWAGHPQERSTIAFQQIVANAAHPLTFYLRVYGYLGAPGAVEGSES
jgi:hypothetical protein